MTMIFSERLNAKVSGWLSHILILPVVGSAISRYQRCSERERHAIKILAVFFILVFVGYGLVLPAFRFASDSRQTMLDSRSDYQWIEAHIDEAKQLSAHSDEQASQGDLLTLASSAASKVDIVFQRYEPDDEGRVRFYMDAVVFDKLLNWIQLLDQEHGIVISQIMINDHKENGKVNAMVQLRE